MTPEAIVVISGKRKTGKDFVANLLQERFSVEVCAVLRLSGPLKLQYAKENELDIARLMDASQYKETYRKDMIKWGEEKRKQEPEYFCRLATSVSEADRNLWIISDARRTTDIEYFLKYYPKTTLTVRIEASQDVREERGFVFKSGVDDAESECGLDMYPSWNHIIHNNVDRERLEQQLQPLINNIEKLLLLNPS